jgi:hypothetical protein
MKTDSNKTLIQTRGYFRNLSDEQREELVGWLNSPRTYEQIKSLVEQKFKIHLGNISPLKRYRTRLRKAAVSGPQQQEVFRPHNIPGEIWVFSLGEMITALGKPDPETPMERRVRIHSFFLQLSRMTMENNRLAEKASKARQSAEPSPLEYADLEDIRRMLFGPPDPATEPPTPATTPSDTTNAAAQ